MPAVKRKKSKQGSRDDRSGNSEVCFVNLPVDALRIILAYSAPRYDHPSYGSLGFQLAVAGAPAHERHRWEWASGAVGQTCRLFRKLAREHTPRALRLDEYSRYYSPYDPNAASFPPDGGIDVRLKMLRSVTDTLWKRERLTEFHIDSYGIACLDKHGGIPDEGDAAEPNILMALKNLLTTSGSLPNLEWLDICVVAEEFWVKCELFDSKALADVPAAIPSVKKLCLAGCFKDSNDDVSPAQFRLFFESLSTPLESLSLQGVDWMSDDHVAAFLPCIGNGLIRLELLDCSVFSFNYETAVRGIPSPQVELTDTTAHVISRECQNLESLSLTGTAISTSGLATVLGSIKGDGMKHLNLNGSNLGSDTMKIISQHAPRLESLRCGGNYRDNSVWFNEDSLAEMVDAQMKHSNGKGIYLQAVGTFPDVQITEHGWRYALERGLKFVELEYGICDDYRGRDLAREFPNVQFSHPPYPTYTNGSNCHRSIPYEYIQYAYPGLPEEFWLLKK